MAGVTDWGYTEDSWEDGWDVLIPWEADLARRIKEHDEFLGKLQGKAGGGPSGYGGPRTSVGTGVGSSGSAGGATSAATTTTAVSTGGA